MKTVNTLGFTVQLELVARFPRDTYRYAVVTPTGVRFHGDAYCPSPMYHTDEEKAVALLFYITLRPGDVDQDYFVDYTPEQLAWAKSFDCEEAAYDVAMAEEEMGL